MNKQQKAIQSIQRAAAQFPQLRIGQLIENARLSAGIDGDLFYIQDERLAEALDRYVRSVK